MKAALLALLLTGCATGIELTAEQKQQCLDEGGCSVVTHKALETLALTAIQIGAQMCRRDSI